MPHPARASSRLLTFFVMAAIMLSPPQSLTTQASVTRIDEDPQTAGFDAQMWQQLYLAISPNQQQDQATTTSAQIKGVADEEKANGGRRLHTRSIPDRMIDLSLAALIVEADQSAAAADGLDGDGPDGAARRMPQLMAAANNPLAPPPGHGNGPSPTTMLVGLVAAIVICGALCAGRD